MKQRAPIVFLAILVLSAACSRRLDPLSKRPSDTEISGRWVSTDKVSGSDGGEMIIVVNSDKSCEITSVPIFVQSVGHYRMLSGRGSWMIIRGVGDQKFQLNVNPYKTIESASLDIMTEEGTMVFRYNDDPESPKWAIFRKR